MTPKTAAVDEPKPETQPPPPAPKDSQQGHVEVEREQRNGFTYIHCACGFIVGPFHVPDYAEDAFAQHAGTKG